MNRVLVFLAFIAVACSASASWYWPFKSWKESEKKEVRLSELMEPASQLIDEAVALEDEGKTSEAIEKYRAALVMIDEIVAENPERENSAEFATIKNKRAYVNGAIDNLHLRQAKSNERSVTTCDTTALEEKLARERWLVHAKAAKAFLGASTTKEEATFRIEIDKASTVTTNNVLCASLHALEAASAFLKGEGDEACHALDRCFYGLGRGVLATNECMAMAKEIALADMKSLAIDWCDSAVASGEVARAACARLADLLQTNESARAISSQLVDVLQQHRTNESAKAECEQFLGDLQRTNETALAVCNLRSDITENFERQNEFLKAYSFYETIALTNETALVMKEFGESTGENLNLARYDAALKDFKDLISQFGGVRRRVNLIERRLNNEPVEMVRKPRKNDAKPVAVDAKPATAVKPSVKEVKKPDVVPAQEPKPKPKKNLSKRNQAIVDINNGDFAAADILIREMLEVNPKSALALNLRATMEIRQGNLNKADDTLYEAIESNPKSHFAYYNMAILLLQKNPNDKANAKHYYETGRAVGGPKDPELEAMFK